MQKGNALCTENAHSECDIAVMLENEVCRQGQLEGGDVAGAPLGGLAFEGTQVWPMCGECPLSIINSDGVVVDEVTRKNVFEVSLGRAANCAWQRSSSVRSLNFVMCKLRLVASCGLQSAGECGWQPVCQCMCRVRKDQCSTPRTS